MTITFPRDLPSTRFRDGSRIYVHRQETSSPTRGGTMQVAELGSPLWRVQYETPPMPEALGAAWEAWIDTLRAGARTFRAVHPFRRLARAYPTGYAGMTKHIGGSFNGVAKLKAVGVALDTVTLEDLPSTFVLSVGDCISFTPSGMKQAFHRIVEGATASSGEATVTVEPIIKPGYTLGADVSLASPWFKAVLDQQSVDVRWQAGRKAVVAFEAWQTLA